MLANYIKLAWKVLGRRKFFTFVSLFGISFTLLVLVVAVAVLDHNFAPLPPEVNQDRTLRLQTVRLGGRGSSSTSHVGWKLIERHARDLPGVEAIALWRDEGSFKSRQRGGNYRIKSVDAAFWKILSFRFLEGGPFSEADVRDRRFVAVIDARTRQRYFDDAPALGKTLELDGQRYQVVGVVPEVSNLREVPRAEVWVPLTVAKRDPYAPVYLGDHRALFLLRSPDDIPVTKAAFAARLKDFQSPDPRRYSVLTANLETHFERTARDAFGSADNARSQVVRLTAAFGLLVAFFMLLPAVNLINLNVSRILERASEIGVRKAFGATSRTLVAQFLIENVLLTLVGAAVGIAASVLVLQGVRASGFFPRAELALNLRVTLYGVALALLFGVISGVYPAWRMSRLQPALALKGGGR